MGFQVKRKSFSMDGIFSVLSILTIRLLSLVHVSVFMCLCLQTTHCLLNFYYYLHNTWQYSYNRFLWGVEHNDFPGDPIIKKPPSNARHKGWYLVGELREACAPQLERSPSTPQLGKASEPQQRPSSVKKKRAEYTGWKYHYTVENTCFGMFGLP